LSHSLSALRVCFGPTRPDSASSFRCDLLDSPPGFSLKQPLLKRAETLLTFIFDISGSSITAPRFSVDGECFLGNSATFFFPYYCPLGPFFPCGGEGSPACEANFPTLTSANLACLSFEVPFPHLSSSNSLRQSQQPSPVPLIHSLPTERRLSYLRPPSFVVKRSRPFFLC